VEELGHYRTLATRPSSTNELKWDFRRGQLVTVDGTTGVVQVEIDAVTGAA